MRGVIGVEAIAGDDRVEHRAAAVGLGAQQPAQPLGLLLAGPNVPDTCTATAASGRSMEKLATLETTRVVISPRRNASNSASRAAVLVDPWMIGASSRSPSSSNWSRSAPITSVCSPGCLARIERTTAILECAVEHSR